MIIKILVSQKTCNSQIINNLNHQFSFFRMFTVLNRISLNHLYSYVTYGFCICFLRINPNFYFSISLLDDLFIRDAFYYKSITFQKFLDFQFVNNVFCASLQKIMIHHCNAIDNTHLNILYMKRIKSFLFQN